MKNNNGSSKYDVAYSRLSWIIVFLVLCSATFRLFSPPGTFRPVLVTVVGTKPILRVVSDESPAIPVVLVKETVLQPEEKLFFLQCATGDRRALDGDRVRVISGDDVVCVYSFDDSSRAELRQPPDSVDVGDRGYVIVRCALHPRGATVSIGLASGGGSGPVLAGPRPHRWDLLAYDAVIDQDDSTVVFVKGLNLRSGRVSDASRFECVYGWDFRSTRFVLRADVMSVAQEIVRCRTPLSVLNRPQGITSSVKVSVRVKGKGNKIVPSVARPGPRPVTNPTAQRPHQVCICTMAQNQGRFLKEWVMYHARVGVTRWFIYDNNSDDDSRDVIESLSQARHNITRHAWPWIKTQEAGFAHCALRARTHCEWVGFIDVDEFFYSPPGQSLPDIIRTHSGSGSIGEIRTTCHDFGPSGHKEAPLGGVTSGYTCRLAMPERHKSIVRPEALSESLVNVVHHFDLREGFGHANVDRGVMVVNHYKYQVWSVFKEKFRRRVATYVSDWQDEVNALSRDRAPGVGFKPVEPADWSDRFCEIWDTGLKDRQKWHEPSKPPESPPEARPPGSSWPPRPPASPPRRPAA